MHQLILTVKVLFDDLVPHFGLVSCELYEDGTLLLSDVVSDLLASAVSALHKDVPEPAVEFAAVILAFAVIRIEGR